MALPEVSALETRHVDEAQAPSPRAVEGWQLVQLQALALQGREGMLPGGAQAAPGVSGFTTGGRRVCGNESTQAEMRGKLVACTLPAGGGLPRGGWSPCPSPSMVLTHRLNWGKAFSFSGPHFLSLSLK